jgi:hypothetical protein
MRLRFAGPGLLLAAGTLFAQTSQPTALVQVIDPTGPPIPQATVSMLATAESAEFHASTNPKGEAQFDLVEGTYKVTVTAQGFRPETKTLVVPSSAGIRIEVVLQVGGCTECVTVSQSLPPISLIPQPPLTALLEPMPLSGKLILRSRRKLTWNLVRN